MQASERRHCRSENIIRHGKDSADRQRLLCHDCRRLPAVGAGGLIRNVCPCAMC